MRLRVEIRIKNNQFKKRFIEAAIRAGTSENRRIEN
jgi:hypothetical protein